LELGEKRSAQYLHLFELMLLLENFCKSDEQKRSSILLLKQIMPSILETLKNTVDRQSGNRMKIIKFHLPLHFADDMLKFGIMANYDSGIGESHHKEFAKQPAANTQRRKNVFEIQAAKRLVENLAIDRAFSTSAPNISGDVLVQENMNKSFKYAYCLKSECFINHGKNKDNTKKLRWNDFNLQCRIGKLCQEAFKENLKDEKIHFLPNTTEAT
jgi:hypothetical protein